METVLDYETQSELDVRTVGAYEYASHPSTRVLCAGFKVSTAPAILWIPGKNDYQFEQALKLSTKIICHNKMFEDCITQFVLPRHGIKVHFNHRQYRCSAAKAALHALPRDLERSSRVMNLSTVKDMEGNRLIKKYMKPRRKWWVWKEAFDKGQAFDWEEPEKYFSDPEELQKIYDYCLTDVETEYLLDKALSHLPKREEEIWILNQEMNFRGVKVDVATSKLILDLISKHTKKLNTELIKITNGEVKTAAQRDKILTWLEENKSPYIENLRADSVAAALKTWEDGPLKRVLEIRQSLSKSSTKKYKALLTRAGADERVRDISMYHGAHTGRDTGTGLQVLNLPRGKIKNIDKAIEIIQSGDLELIELIYGDPLDAFSSVIRGMITATNGWELYDADYNAIECRILNWLAGQHDVLEMFRKDIDLYVKMAERLGSDDRQFGKTVELAGGYQMGPGKLQATSIAWGLRDGKGITEEEAELGIKVYRDSHPRVVQFWARTEKAAIRAVRDRSIGVVTNGSITWAMQKEFLTCRLPSGRRMYYFKPEVRQEPTPWGEFRPKLYYWHIESMTKQWVCSATYGGKLVENIVQGVSRDIMFDAALRLKEKGYHYLFNAYDELVSEAKGGSLKEYENILMTLPAWAKGLPIKASGWTDFRYRKA